MTNEKHEDGVIAWAAGLESSGNLRSAARCVAVEADDSSTSSLWDRWEHSGKERVGQAVVEPGRQQQILETLCSLQASGTAYDPYTRERLGLVQLREDGSLLLAPSVGCRLLLVQLASYHASYCCAWDPSAGFHLDTLRLFADRVQRRSSVSSRVKLRFTNNLGVDVAGTVVDVSSGGIGAVFDLLASVPSPGQRLGNCVVTWKGGPELQIDVRVARVCAKASFLRVGLELQGTADAWCELVEELQFPDTVRGNVDADLVWSAYVASGYLNISGKESRCFERDRPAFHQAQELLAQSPEVGAIFSGGRREQPEAYIHHVQAWPGAWINVHLCRLSRGRTLRTSDDGILLRLYEHCYAFALARRTARWLVTYTHSQDTAYSHRLHCEFARGLSADAGCVRPFEPIEVSGIDASVATENVIGDATRLELVRLRQALLAQLPLPYLQAMVLTTDDLGIVSMSSAWRGSGLERARSVLVARRGGRMIAAAILDFASTGMHVYGLFDKVRLLRVEPGGHDAFDALLAAAHQRYAERDQNKFIYFRDLDAPPVGGSVRHVSLGNANINVVSREQFGRFLEHVFLLHARALNHTRADGRSFSTIAPRVSAVRSLFGKGGAESSAETSA